MGGYVQNGAGLTSVPSQSWFLGVSISLCPASMSNGLVFCLPALPGRGFP